VQGRINWAIIPAIVLSIMGIVISLAAAKTLLRFIWPAILIAFGIYLVYKTIRPR
jgi:hypothetical protein